MSSRVAVGMLLLALGCACGINPTPKAPMVAMPDSLWYRPEPGESLKVFHTFVSQGLDGEPLITAASAHCGLNGEPFLLIAGSFLSRGGYALEMAEHHEQIHAQQARKFKGGCFAYMERYREDVKFRIESEREAYCDTELWAKRRNDEQIKWATYMARIAFEQKYGEPLGCGDTDVKIMLEPDLGQRRAP